MKRLLKSLTAAALALTLAACGSPASAPASVSSASDAVPVVSAAPEDDPNDAHSFYECRLTRYDDGTVSALVEAFAEDYSIRWQYETPRYPIGQLETLEGLCSTPEGYLFHEADRLILLSVHDGSILWENSDYHGGSSCCALSEAGVAYITGFDGPLMLAVDTATGKTLKQLDTALVGAETHALTGASWSDFNEEDGCLSLYYDEQSVVLVLDPETGKGYYSRDEYGETDAWVQLDQVYVSTPEELFSNLRSNTQYLLAPGVYDLTDWITNGTYDYTDGSSSELHPLFEADGLVEMWDDDSPLPDGVIAAAAFDGPALWLSGYSGIILSSADFDAPAAIVCQPRYAAVLGFAGCQSVTLSGLVFGHTPDQGYCEGPVLRFVNSDCMYIENCDLYGCGTYGIEADGSFVDAWNTCIRDCSYGCIAARDSYLTLNGCVLRDCPNYTAFDLRSDTTLMLYECTLNRLGDRLVDLGRGSSLYLYAPRLDASAGKLLEAARKQYGSDRLAVAYE